MFVIYSKPNCGYCDMAKRVFNTKGIKFTELPAVEKIDDLKRLVKEAIGSEPRTVPQIFHQKDDNTPLKYVGGYTELIDYIKNLS